MATTLLHWAARGVPDKRCTWGSLVPAELTHQSLRLRHWVPHSHSCHFLSQIPSLSMPGQSLLVVVENRKRAVEYCRTKHTAWIWGPDVLQRLQEDERSVILRPRATPESLYVDTHREPDRDLVFSSSLLRSCFQCSRNAPSSSAAAAAWRDGRPSTTSSPGWESA